MKKNTEIKNLNIPVIFIDNHRSYQTVASVSLSLSNNFEILEILNYLITYINKPIVIPRDIEDILKFSEIETIKFQFNYKRLSQIGKKQNFIFPKYYDCFFEFSIDDKIKMYRGITFVYSLLSEINLIIESDEKISFDLLINILEENLIKNKNDDMKDIIKDLNPNLNWTIKNKYRDSNNLCNISETIINIKEKI